jgi:hypothetical protein
VAGLTDAYRARHPEGLDYIFVIRQHTIQIRGCGYLQAPWRQGLTDHAAITLTLAVASSATGTLR